MSLQANSTPDKIIVMNEKEIKFSPETLELVQGMMKRYPEGKHKSALIPILHVAQAEFDGWLSTAVMDYVASILNIQPIEVYEVASFYSMFNLKPVGKCMIEVCRTSSCWLLGAEDVIIHLENKLGIRPGETTPDGMFTLKTVECLGSCGTAPMMQVGPDYFENLTLKKVDELVDRFAREGKRRTYLDKAETQNM
jgi:NADH-quinone oxidoreductase subunit E